MPEDAPLEADPPQRDGRTRESARPRPAARVLLLDAEDRVLMIENVFAAMIPAPKATQTTGQRVSCHP